MVCLPCPQVVRLRARQPVARLSSSTSTSPAAAAAAPTAQELNLEADRALRTVQVRSLWHISYGILVMAYYLWLNLEADRALRTVQVR